MRIVSAEEETGVTVPSPYDRTIKVLLAPDRRDVSEITLSHVVIPPGGGTDMHEHDRPELIYIISGRARSACDDTIAEIGPHTALWVGSGELHKLVNAGEGPLTFVTVFVPAYAAEEIYATVLERAAEHP
jgi:mannose-6-phosphate isomerase-like protein (cupin superfamily)